MKEIEIITNICKSSKHALSLSMEGYFVTPDSKLYQGWWDEICPIGVEEKFNADNCCQWLKDNIAGAKFLYILTAFWGSDHTKYYVFEYDGDNYRFTSDTFAIT